MKKEKTVKTYQRRTKTGKVVTVHEHKSSYDAAEEAMKEAAKKQGAGNELLAKKKKVADVEENPLGFTDKEFKEWYHWDTENDAKNESALKVEKTLKKKMGARGYKKYFDEMTEGYSARGHLKAHKALTSSFAEKQKEQDAQISKAAKDLGNKKALAETHKKATKGDTDQVKKRVSEQNKYVKDLMRVYKSGDKATQMKSYIAAEKKILDDLKRHKGALKSQEEMTNSEKALAKKYKLSYEGDGMYSDKSGRTYRISTHPITGNSTMHPLIGNVAGATKAQLRAAGLKGNDYDSVDWDKVKTSIWGRPKNSSSKGDTPTTKAKSSAEKKSSNSEDTPTSKVKKAIKDLDAKNLSRKNAEKSSTKTPTEFTEIPKTYRGLKEGTYNLGSGIKVKLSKEKNGIWRGEATRSGYHMAVSDSSELAPSKGTHEWLSYWKTMANMYAKDAERKVSKLPKGSFRTVDSKGKEIEGAPKHGTKSKVSKSTEHIPTDAAPHYIPEGLTRKRKKP